MPGHKRGSPSFDAVYPPGYNFPDAPDYEIPDLGNAWNAAQLPAPAAPPAPAVLDQLAAAPSPADRWDELVRGQDGSRAHMNPDHRNEHRHHHLEGPYMASAHRAGADVSRVVTRHYDDQDRAAHKLGVDGDGRLRDANGALFDTTAARASSTEGSKAGYNIWAADGGGNTYATDANAEVRASVDAEKGKSGGTLQVTHHSTFLEGQNVRGGRYDAAHDPGVMAAGEMRVEGGHLAEINNNSGHYRPDAGHMYNQVTNLGQQGAIPHQHGEGATRVGLHTPGAGGDGMVRMDAATFLLGSGGSAQTARERGAQIGRKQMVMDQIKGLGSDAEGRSAAPLNPIGVYEVPDLE